MLRWIDGFDELPSGGAGAAYLPTAGYLGATAVDAGLGRGDGGTCLIVNNGGALHKTFPVQGSPGDALTLGLGFRYVGSLGNATILTLNNAGGVLITLSRNNSNGLVLTVGGNTVSTPNEVIQGSVWAYIEVQLVWDATPGADRLILRVNNVVQLTASIPDLIGRSPDRILYRNDIAATGHHFDDIYIVDGTGTANTSFFGDIFVENAYIESNADMTEFTPMGSVSNFLNINDTGVANEARFNASEEIGARDVFHARNLNVVGDQIFGVQLGLRVKKVGSGTLSLSSLAILAAAEVQSPGVNPDASYQTHYFTMNVDPSGAVWTVEAFNDTRFGYELTY